ncbi:tRNA lysidine(34) synthetase TilS [Lactobacillus sp. LL6]|uniref:tRNA lysidine(34) synthetase TilS n=1 Tax=Lactobacillus sp. LL6 TaxID=2596827 RepID=UPI0011872D20|nr:tRNA lysidine(34) synthetase TilS [Lactobacillus sp. LL6]TSO25807.1 tRNA lysidine(34) synthetase TilS [Lactobacillus sp. LL6]
MKIEKFFKTNKIKLNNQTLVVAASAGPDSMALLKMLAEMRAKYKIRLIAAHFDHQLRKDSEEESILLRKFCQDEEIELIIKKWTNPIKGKGLEAAARKARYAFLTETVKKANAAYLLTAHHGDDLIENILLKFIRSGNPSEMNSLQEIGKMNGVTLLRPLFDFEKQELLDYDKKFGITYVVDSTNNEDAVLRNRLRHHVVPLLKQENNNLVENAVRFSHQMKSLTSLASTRFAKIPIYSFLDVAFRAKTNAIEQLSSTEQIEFWQEVIWQKYHRRVNKNLGDYRIKQYQGYYYLIPNKVKGIKSPIQKIELDKKFIFRNERFLLTSVKKSAYTLIGDFWAESADFSAGSLNSGAKLLLQNGHHVKSKKKFAQAAIPSSLRTFCLTIYQNKEPVFVEKTYQNQKQSVELSHYYIYQLKKA